MFQGRLKLELSQSGSVNSMVFGVCCCAAQLCVLSLPWLQGRLWHCVPVLLVAKPGILVVPGAQPLSGTQHPSLGAFPGLGVKFSLGLQEGL